MLGSRYVSGGGVRDWGLLRRLVSRGGGLYARTILRVDVHDLTGGFKCIRREVLEAIDLDSVRAEGYVFQIEVTYRARARRIPGSRGADCVPGPHCGYEQDVPSDRDRGDLARSAPAKERASRDFKAKSPVLGDPERRGSEQLPTGPDSLT